MLKCDSFLYLLQVGNAINVVVVAVDKMLRFDDYLLLNNRISSSHACEVVRLYEAIYLVYQNVRL